MNHFEINLQFFAAEENVITSAQMVKAREVDFVRRFTGTFLAKFLSALGVTRKLPMMEGTTLYYYTTTGTLQDGTVAEGDIIPLSRYERQKVPFGEIALKKFRKAVTAEAIMKSGYTEAVTETDKKMILDVQDQIRTAFFTHLTGIEGSTVVGGTTLQAVLARTWAKLQVLFENDSVEAVHFINPETIADYLSNATITMQTAFGMNYIENFLGLGTVVMSSRIPQGEVISTAKDNLIMYYLRTNGEVANAFNLTTDETGYIGIHTTQTDNRAQIEKLVMYAITFLVEFPAGVVVGMIDATPTLGSVTVASTEGTAVGDSNIAMSGYTLGSGEKWMYKTAKTTAPAVTYGQKLGTGWTQITSGTDITPTATHDKITVAAVDANGRAQAAGSATITVKT